MDLITLDDLAPFADIPADKAKAMIIDAEATAVRVAPCLSDPSFPHRDAAKAILRRAILRWNEVGVSGAVTSQTAGPFSQTMTTQPSHGLLWPSEITDLQKLCKEASGKGRAFTVTPSFASPAVSCHAETCSIMWGGACSCGSDINGFEGPLYEDGDVPERRML